MKFSKSEIFKTDSVILCMFSLLVNDMSKYSPGLLIKSNTVNSDTQLLRTVFIIPGERKPLLFLNLFNTDIPVNTDAFYGPLSPYKEV